MTETMTHGDPKVLAGLLEDRLAADQLSEEQRQILNGIRSDAIILLVDGRDPDKIRTLQEQHPEGIDALDALSKIP